MKFRIFLIMLVASLLPMSVSSCGSSGKEDGGIVNPTPEPEPDPEPEEGKALSVRIVGENCFVAAKLDASHDILYWFKRCLFNEVYTFYRVGIINSTAAEPTSRPEQDPTVVMNLAYSDNLGPFGVSLTEGGSSWSGANHTYKEDNKTRTAYNDKYAFYVDGKRITDQNKSLRGDVVKIEVENVILDPRRSYTNTSGATELRDELIREVVTYNIRGNSIEVVAKHRFVCTNPVTITVYYGMQSMFERESEIMTPGDGPYHDWTEKATVDANQYITRTKYPNFSRFLERNETGVQSTYLFPEGLGDHSRLAPDKRIFLSLNYGKSYHNLISDGQFKNGETTTWHGLYTWYIKPIHDNSEVLCYEGNLGGHRVLFVDAKTACDRDITLPEGYTVEGFKVLNRYGTMTISSPAAGKMHVLANGPASMMIQLAD